MHRKREDATPNISRDRSRARSLDNSCGPASCVVDLKPVVAKEVLRFETSEFFHQFQVAAKEAFDLEIRVLAELVLGEVGMTEGCVR